jgi:hypothetical protein
MFPLARGTIRIMVRKIKEGNVLFKFEMSPSLLVQCARVIVYRTISYIDNSSTDILTFRFLFVFAPILTDRFCNLVRTGNLDLRVFGKAEEMQLACATDLCRTSYLSNLASIDLAKVEAA